MKLSKAAPYGVGAGFLAGLATAGVLLIGSSHPSQPAQIVVRNDAATASATHSTSAAVAKPAAVVPRSSVVVKKPAVQEATVTDPSTDASAPASAPESATPVPTESSRPSGVDNPVGQPGVQHNGYSGSGAVLSPTPSPTETAAHS
jgi:cell envelope opacity-associated protein A